MGMASGTIELSGILLWRHQAPNPHMDCTFEMAGTLPMLTGVIEDVCG
jgi:hypothetical protein